MRLPRKREQVLRTISSRIEAGIYSTGERIPTEPMLAKEFGVARETLRGALEILEKRGLIQRFPGEGTYVRRREEGARELYLLIPCPDYFVISDYQTRTTLREILCGCLTEANRRNAHVVTLPITKDNNPCHLNRQALEQLPEGSRVIFYSHWCAPVFPFLKARRCRVYCIHPLTFEGLPDNEYLSGWSTCQADIAGAVAASVEKLHQNGCRRIAIATSFLDDSYNPAKAGYLEGLHRYNPRQNPICRDIGGYEEEPLLFREPLAELYREQPFDGLIFGIHDEIPMNYRQTLHWNLGLPSDVRIITIFPYPYNRNFLPHIPCFCFDYHEMARVAAHALLSEPYQPENYQFRNQFQHMEELK